MRNAAVLRRRFEATERKLRVSGISRACSIGFSICSCIKHKIASEQIVEYLIIEVAFLENEFPQPPLNGEHVGENRRGRDRELNA
jgi:hypothetical protein